MSKNVVVQDMKIFQQLISALPQTGNQFFFLMNQNVEGEKGVQEPKNGDFSLMEYLEKIPQPRLMNLTNKIAELALRKFGNKTVAGHWLGGSRSLISHFRVAQGKEPLTETEEMEEDLKPEIKILPAPPQPEPPRPSNLVRPDLRFGKEWDDRGKRLDAILSRRSRIPQDNPHGLLEHKDFEREELEKALAHCGWRRVETAKVFQRNVHSIYSAIKRFRIIPPGGKWPKVIRSKEKREGQ